MTTEQEKEKKLIAKAQAGDAEAFEAIVRAHEKLLYNFALRMLGNREDAADAVQEAFLKAFTGLGAFRGESKLSSWLCRILNNACIDILRKRKETLPLDDGDAGEGEAFQARAEIPDERFDPAAALERADLRERVRAAVTLLPADFKAPLLLREYEGLSYAEIAEALELDVNTVRTRIFRARKKLCGILAGDGNFLPKNPSDTSKGGARE